MWGCGAFKTGMPNFKRQKAVPGGCLNSPNGLRRYSPTVHPNIGRESTTEEKEAELLVGQEDLPNVDLWAKLVDRANEDQSVINGHPVTAFVKVQIRCYVSSKDVCIS